MKSNPIQNIVISRLKSLMSQYELASAIEHMPTRGQLREKYLIDFFKDVIPQRYNLDSGIICDAKGDSSRQLDFIVSDNTFLPAMALHEGVSLVPIESAIMNAEIKSTLTKDSLKQVSAQNESVENLGFTNRKFEGAISLDNGKVLLPSAILAFESNVKEETIIEWMEDNKRTFALCVINKFSILKLGSEKPQIIRRSVEEPEFWETLVFVGKLYHALEEVSNSRVIRPNWDQYMQGYKE
jgi:hypothetical protein